MHLLVARKERFDRLGVDARAGVLLDAVPRAEEKDAARRAARAAPSLVAFGLSA
jgi:hypothetical protein